MLTHERLLELVTYSPDTGEFKFKSTRGGRLPGDTAGYAHASGYWYIMIDRVTYALHRLAWFYCFKERPAENIDHIDRNRSNNSLDNLREASKIENGYNMSMRKDNSTGFKGVTLDKRTNKFMSRVTINKKQYYLGMFNTAQEAFNARDKKARELQGEFYSEDSFN